MNVSTDTLAARLVEVLGADAVATSSATVTDFLVDGAQPKIVCSPNSPETIANALRICNKADAAVTPWGGGTAISLGNPPKRMDVTLCTHRVAQVLDYDHANLTITVQSGLTYADLAEILARRQQCFAVDVPFPETSTLGGIVAANLNGLRRSCYGSVRDLVIGMKVALAGGDVIKAGGKVVKNVAGYDLCKLFTGSLGTLGVITELTLRVSPMPESSATILVEGSFDKLASLAFADAIIRLLPAARVWQGKVTEAGALTDGKLVVRFDGFASVVRRQEKSLILQTHRDGLQAVSLTASDAQQLWQAGSEFPFGRNRTIYRVIIPPAAINEFLRRLTDLKPGCAIDSLCDLASGTLWLSHTRENTPTDLFNHILQSAIELRGHAVLCNSSAEVKNSCDVWGQPPASIHLMRRIKQQFDPKGILNPGRLLRGIEPS